jgi:4-diphosphocytidyl-2-C-methyl-D-erythritol kinase
MPIHAQGPFTAEFPWPAPAKLNLFLHITGRRNDGYHLLQTVFQILDYGDSLYFTPRGDGVIRRLGGLETIPPEQDLVVRAAQLLARASGCNLGADVRIEKRIPIGGGLGGGSSDAATTLVALNRLWNLGFTPDELMSLGLNLGADVPVFVRGLSAWGEGVGERLLPVRLPEPWFLVITPPVAVSTAAVFGAAELERNQPPVNLQDFLAGRTVNICEPVTCTRYPEVAEALAWLARHAPARMSGTGASVFAAFATREQAVVASREVPRGWSCFVARGCNRSPLLDAVARS